MVRAVVDELAGWPEEVGTGRRVPRYKGAEGVTVGWVTAHLPHLLSSTV